MAARLAGSYVERAMAGWTGWALPPEVPPGGLVSACQCCNAELFACSNV
jgi:hypothetical protein